MEFKGSKTEKNLYRTFAGESRARNKYTLFAEKARKEGYSWVGETFDTAAHHELGHARGVFNWLKLLGSTKENLMSSLYGEVDEYTKVYKQYEEEARTEGFNEIADFYKELREVEEHHAKMFKGLLAKLENGMMFKGPADSKWICMNCGYIHEGPEAPLNCPLCEYPRGYYKPFCESTEE